MPESMNKLIWNFICENVAGIILTLIIVAIILLVISGISKTMAYDKALMEQCLEDGNKRYECVGILRRGRR